VVLGRRGPAEASFTTPELQELGELAGADVVVDAADLEGAEPEGTNAERNLAVLRDFAGREPSGKARTVRLRFFLSPVEIRGDGRVESIELVRNRLEERDGRLVAVPTGERETLDCGLVFRSVGYRGVALAGVPFDEARATIRNDRGRVLGDDGAPIPGLYCAGWIKRGPTGIIGTNKRDGTETVQLLFEDVQEGRLVPKGAAAAAVEELLAERDARVVLYPGWSAIDERERAAGEKLGRPRVKLVTWDELLDAAGDVAAATG
jgi:ferredoxin--NADP+ reductase